MGQGDTDRAGESALVGVDRRFDQVSKHPGGGVAAAVADRDGGKAGKGGGPPDAPDNEVQQHPRTGSGGGLILAVGGLDRGPRAVFEQQPQAGPG